MRRALALTTCGLLLAGCNIDDDNVSWQFVSNPSGSTASGGGGLIVIVTSSSSPATGPATRSLIVPGTQQGRPATARLATSCDLALVERLGEVELRCPSLPAGFVVVRGGSAREQPQGAALWLLDVPDASAVHPSGFGPGTLHAAALGNVVVLEHQAGLVVFGAGPQPEVLPPGVRVDPSGAFLQLTELGQPPRVLRGSAPPGVTQRVTYNQSRRSVRILGPRKELLAEVPQNAVTMGGGAGGVFLSASFPQGLGNIAHTFELVAATDNRYLLRVDTR